METRPGHGWFGHGVREMKARAGEEGEGGLLKRDGEHGDGGWRGEMVTAGGARRL